MFNLKSLLQAKDKKKTTEENLSFGLDIGSSQIKLAVLKKEKEIICLIDFNLKPVKLDLALTLKEILQSYPNASLNISFSGQQSVIRYVVFPKMNPQELRQALKFEISKYIPFTASEVNLDAYILKDDLAQNKMLVLIAAVKKEALTQRLKLMEDAGLKVKAVDLDSLALINCYNFNYSSDSAKEQDAFGLLNIGHSVSNFNILQAGIPRLSRDIFVASGAITRKIADILALEPQQAEAVKISPSKEKEDKVKAAVESSLLNLATEIRNSCDYYESQSSATVAKILLSGGGSHQVWLKENLEKFLNIEVSNWDPLNNLQVSSQLDKEKVRAIKEELPVAIGLALRDLI